MSDLSAFQILKNNTSSNIEDWLRATSIVSWGVVSEVIDKSICKVEKLVQNTISPEIFIMPVIVPSSALLEVSAAPQKGDTVLMLFVDLYNKQMFADPVTRYETSDPKAYQVKDPDAVGYNKYSGIGILMAPKTGNAITEISHGLSADGTPFMVEQSRAKITKILRRELALLFDSLPDGASKVDRIINIVFGQNSPLVEEHYATTSRHYGYAELPNGNLEAVTADVDEKYSKYAPKTVTHEAGLTVDIGVGTGGDPDMSASVSFTLGDTADIGITSKSKLTASFKKDVALSTLSGAKFTVNADGKLVLDSNDAVELMAGISKLVKIGSSVGTLGAQIDSLITILQGINTLGSSTAQSLNPAVVIQLTNWKTQWDTIFS